MCLRVFIGCAAPLPVGPWLGAPEHLRVEELPDSAERVRALLDAPHAYELGAHTGCACGFNSGVMPWVDLERSEEVDALLASMTDEERADFRAEQRAREALSALLAQLCALGTARLYGCWWGEEALETAGRATVSAGHFRARAEPVQERFLYEVRA